MMAYERSESTQDNFSKFINQLQPKTKNTTQATTTIFRKKIENPYIHWLLNHDNSYQLLFNEEFIEYFCDVMSIYFYGNNIRNRE